MLKRFFHAMDTHNEIFHSLLFPDLALKKTLELNVAELWAVLDSDLNIVDRVLVYFCLLQCKFFILCCSVLYHLQGKGLWTRNRFAHEDLGCGGNSSSFLPHEQSWLLPSCSMVSTERWRVTSTHRCCQMSLFLSKNAQEYLVESQDLTFRQLDMSTPACDCIPPVDLVNCYLFTWVAFCTNHLHIPSMRNLFFY